MDIIRLVVAVPVLPAVAEADRILRAVAAGPTQVVAAGEGNIKNYFIIYIKRPGSHQVFCLKPLHCPFILRKVLAAPVYTGPPLFIF